VAGCKGRGRQGQGKDSVVQGTWKGQTFGRRRQAQLECNNGIRDRGLRQQQCLGSKRKFNKTTELETVKQIVRTYIRLRKMMDWTLWRGWPPLKLKKGLHTE
jgi:hypothetical protein